MKTSSLVPVLINQFLFVLSSLAIPVPAGTLVAKGGIESLHVRSNSTEVLLARQPHCSGPTAPEIWSSYQSVLKPQFQEAWEATYPEEGKVQEAGGWIYVDQENSKRVCVRRANVSKSNVAAYTAGPEAKVAIHLEDPPSSSGRGDVCEGMVIIATYHTHPTMPNNGGDPSHPSQADNRNAWRRGVPGIVIHENGVIYYGPECRESLATTGPTGVGSTFPYSGAPAPDGVAHLPGKKLCDWKPKKASRQP
ncbi:hypothetical protein H0H92_007651 [Tricholoma furcatifolium]|nr:hypothetical protein H0H92_007651 [Tricholoma furcatifolium]